MNLKQALGAVRLVDENARAEVQQRLDSIIKPLGSLGVLERHLVKIAGMTGKHTFDFSKKAVVVFCADNGVVAQKITQSEQDVTAIVTENLATGDTCLCAMARVAGAQVVPVDIGVARDLETQGLVRCKIAYGTNDFSQRPAMTRLQAEKAVEVGIDMALQLCGQGFTMLATGEMGIGNTASSAAVASALLRLDPELTTGRGSGLSTAALNHKVNVIRTALELHRPDPNDPLDVLSKVGGYDIAGMAGLCIGGAICGVPVVLDGLISAVSALVACSVCPVVVNFILPSHLSPEPACSLVLDALGLDPPLHGGLRLGEGTGAVATFPLYDMILAVYNEMVTFDDESMEAYRPLE